MGFGRTMVLPSFVIIRPSDTSDQGSPAEDPRKIDSTWHIPPGWKKRELGLSQLTRDMVAVWEKMGAEIRSRTATQMARTSIPWSWWGWCPATGILTRFRPYFGGSNSGGMADTSQSRRALSFAAKRSFTSIPSSISLLKI